MEELSIVVLKNQLLLTIIFETETLKDAKASLDLSNSLLEGCILKVYALILWLIWILNYITCVNTYCLEAGLSNSWLSILGVECFDSFDTMLN